MTDFEELIQRLQKSRVDFLIVGGLAATVHGSARLTQDLDIVYSRSIENIGRLVTALAPLAPYLRGAPEGLPFRLDVETVRRGLNFTLQTRAGALALLGEITGGGDYAALVGHTITVMLFGISVAAIDLETLIRVKRAAGRPKDLEVIAELEALREEQRD
jgi:hypothetical protein